MPAAKEQTERTASQMTRRIEFLNKRIARDREESKQLTEQLIAELNASRT
jgi:hypothetical protein